MRKLTRAQKQQFALLRRQMCLFDRTAAALQHEFANLPEATEALATVTRLCSLMSGQRAAADAILTVAQKIDGQGNLTPAFMKAYDEDSNRKLVRGHGLYEFLTNQRHMVEQIGEMDEWNKLLGATRPVMEAAKPHQADAKIWDRACETGWRLMAGQDQIDSLLRQAEAITFTQLGLFRSFGLKFWQGHKRYLRFEGQNQG